MLLYFCKKLNMDLDQKDWFKKQKNNLKSIILDVRTKDEYKEGHIPNAFLIDIRNPQEFMDNIYLLDNKKFYFIYCRSGARSAQACQLMKQVGIKNCFNLLGGILDWQGQIIKD